MELVEGTAGGIHLGVVLPRLRDHHQHRVREGSAAEVQQLEHLVERGGVARVRGDDGGEAREVARDQLALQQRFAGGHPVAVAAQRVDLAVVRDVAVGVRERPRRERVGGEPGVHERQRADHALVGEVRVERLDLGLGQHALVDDRARGQRGEVDVGGVLGALAQAEGAALQLEAVSPAAPATNSWRIVGITLRAVGPRSAPSASVGSSRQPSTRGPLRPRARRSGHRLGGSARWAGRPGPPRRRLRRAARTTTAR